ncbi:MAG TPA: universal stress protein [Steroidobacteraceae bacterium]
MKLLCATDLQPRSDAALDRAVQLGNALNASLTIVHVVPPVGAEHGTLEQRLLSASGRLAHRARHAGDGIQLVLRCGRPSTVICEEALAADLVVVGPHRRAALSETWRGTPTEQLLSRARKPVLVARRPGKDAYRTVLLALDGSPATEEVLRLTERLPLAENAQVAVVHAHEPPYEAMMNTVGVGNLSVASYASASMSQAASMIQAELQRHSQDPRRYRVLVVDSRPGAAIRQAVRDVRPDLLVLGTRGHGRFRRALLGSTAHEVLRSAECDVLLVPEGVNGHAGQDDPGPLAA